MQASPGAMHQGRPDDTQITEKPSVRRMAFPCDGQSLASLNMPLILNWIWDLLCSGRVRISKDAALNGRNLFCRTNPLPEGLCIAGDLIDCNRLAVCLFYLNQSLACQQPRWILQNPVERNGLIPKIHNTRVLTPPCHYFWQWGQKWVPRPASTIRRIGVPQTRHGWPSRA